MSNGFYGFTIGGTTELVYFDGNADPEVLGGRVLQYTAEMNAPTTKDLAQKLMLVDPDERPDVGYVEERFPELFRARFGALVDPEQRTWADWFGPFQSIGTDLARGVVGDATFYGDSRWGYILNFDLGGIEVFRRELEAPEGYSGRVVEGSMYLVISFGFDWLPSRDVFIDGINGVEDEATPWTR